jgi:N-sulfoglucosamine sulfohydrolase
MGKRKTKEYLYRPKEELYDLEIDPAESNNLAADSNHQGVLKELRAKLGSMRSETNDYWLINDNYEKNGSTFPRW